ncbi:MAG: anthranilate phosphoribosyltransferase [Gemmatimonadales bacterium]|nr:MAG: anthranilate phosphoribosyltransferase [Gemmatimonadales bacterium]
MDLKDLIASVAAGHNLSEAESESAFGHLMSGTASPVQIAALLVGLRAKGHTAAEVAGGVRALRTAMIPVQVPGSQSELGPLVDTCGTGGGAVTTFNISTAAALVAAGAGARVAKHGNRSFTSKSGSADVLEALGVEIQLSPEAMGAVLAEAGVVFMFAPLLHPAMRHVGPVRRELGIPTIMNLLGPLTNPAGVRRQVVGVSEPELVPLLVDALQALGHEQAMVVHGFPGMDEMSPMGPTRVAELVGGRVLHHEVTAELLGLTPASADEIAGGTPAENAERIEAVLSGRDRGGARTVTLMNAAAALRVGGLCEDLPHGVARAAEALDSGAALDRLERLRSATRRYGAS